MGRCGMTRAQAARTSMAEYRMRVEGHEQEMHERYELARWTVWHKYNLSPWLKVGARPKKPSDVFRFAWETPDKKKKITRKQARVSEAEAAALEALMKDFYNRKYSS